MTQNNLGNALWTLGARESGTARLEEAFAAYRDALKERTRERVPLQWDMSTGNQGVALTVLAERRRDLAMAKRAQAQISAAFETFAVRVVPAMPPPSGVERGPVARRHSCASDRAAVLKGF
jgi:hypothetical protein